MGLLDRAIKKGLREGVGRAVGEAVKKAVEPTANNLANKAAQQMNNMGNQMQNSVQNTMQSNGGQNEGYDNGMQQSASRSGGLGMFSGLEGAFANLEKAAQGFATEVSKNVKVCPACNQPASADKKFCPKCGTALPEQTVSEASVCPNCGKQNDIGTKFCQDCGTKLPAAVQEEQVRAQREAAVMEEWDAKIPTFPKWNCGGSNFCLENYEQYIMFSADFAGNNSAARNAVEQYRNLLLQNGFRPAGQYPDNYQLYNMIGGYCYHVDLEHCFDGDGDCPCIYFAQEEPAGGFNYVKPEAKKVKGLFDLFN